jgi:spore coat polysaccharide biosynthesis protein SpsF
MNLQALKLLIPSIKIDAIEINKEACKKLEKVIERKNIFNQSILESEIKNKYDLVLIKGVLIHINPEELPIVYDKLVQAAKKYILIMEYYNPTPVSVTYKGQKDRLFKRDFAGEIMDRHKNIKLLDYGFLYHRDLNFPMDDGTWFLMEKTDF